MIYLWSWDYNIVSVLGVWWCIGLVCTYFLGLLVCETELGFKHRYKREIQDQQYCLVYRDVSHGAPIQDIRVLADHTHGGITLSIFGYVESFCMFYCTSRLLHYDIGSLETGHYASLPFRPLHTELLNTVHSPTHHLWLGLGTWG